MKRAMKIPRVVALLLFFCFRASAGTGCDTAADLSTHIAQFDAQQVSPIEALLRLGEKLNLCFGIEYVDQALLTNAADFHLRDTTIKGAIEAIMRSAPPLTIEQHYGVIEILAKTRNSKSRDIFDFVIHRWEASRAPIQLVSTTLYWELRSELNPQITGFAGRSAGGDVSDEVGPFSESNKPVRSLLDKIVAQSRGAAWIAQVPRERVGDTSLVEERRVWTIVEYDGPKADYSGLLRGVAAQL